MTVPCCECKGVGSIDPACKGPKKCPKARSEDGRQLRRCEHAPCKTCRGRGSIDNDVWFDKEYRLR